MRNCSVTLNQADMALVQPVADRLGVSVEIAVTALVRKALTQRYVDTPERMGAAQVLQFARQARDEGVTEKS